MGISNGTAHITRRLGIYISELDEKRRLAKEAKAASESLPDLTTEITRLEELVRASELLLRDLDPTWNSSRVKPKRKHKFQSPFPLGQAGRMALDVLRETGESMTARDIVRQMFEQAGVTDYERDILDKQTNSLGAYLKKHRGDLVESDGGWPQRWRLIRPIQEKVNDT